MARRIIAAMVFTLVGMPLQARAEYARPPDDAYPLVPEREGYPAPGERSTVRIFTGPALRLTDAGTGGGLSAALDVGSRAAGGRISGWWLGAGDAGGVSQYTAELWIDFGEGELVHPIVGAGAGLARLPDSAAADGDDETMTIGVGVLRGSLQYRLPVRDVDARVAADLIGAVPAVRGAGDLPEPWLCGAITVGVGF